MSFFLNLLKTNTTLQAFSYLKVTPSPSCNILATHERRQRPLTRELCKAAQNHIERCAATVQELRQEHEAGRAQN